MAFISKEQVQAKQQKLKAVNKRYGVTARFSGSNSSSLTLTITKGKLKFPNTTGGSVSEYWLDNNKYEPDTVAYLKEVFKIIKEDWWDESDVMTDYFNTAFYYKVHVGKWNKPYVQQ